jgi:predicted HD phosphohydrolase
MEPEVLYCIYDTVRKVYYDRYARTSVDPIYFKSLKNVEKALSVLQLWFTYENNQYVRIPNKENEIIVKVKSVFDRDNMSITAEGNYPNITVRCTPS